MAEPLPPVDPEALLRSEVAHKTLDLPLLPGVAAEVLATSMDSDGDASKLAALIQQDQALASNVLRIVNSPTYRGATEIVALQQAIARLGMALIREVALSVSLKAALDQPGPYDTQVQQAWTQALAAALWSKEVARRCRKNVENAYLCGLLHNIGLPVVLHRLAAISAEASSARPLPQTKAVALAEEFAIDAAVMLVREWRLPELVATCLVHLDDFNAAAEDSDAVAIVVVGVALARAVNETGLECEQIQQWPALVHLNLYPDEVAELVNCQQHINELLLGMNGSGSIIVTRVQVFVIGSGPAGQKAAIQAAKGGCSVAICEHLREIGGACVQYGTIPSKTLRERAVARTRAIAEVQRSSASNFDQTVSVAELIGETGAVLRAHDQYMTAQLERNGVAVIHGRASFIDPHTLEVQYANGQSERFETDYVIIASGSKPRGLSHIPTDHEHIYDSDSILSLGYLPRSMLVFGGGVIACEYASIFALLGVEVTLIDRYPQPLGFLDQDLAAHFLSAFEDLGGRFLGEHNVTDVRFDGVSGVRATFDDGATISADKALCALGRVSQVAHLAIKNAGLSLDERDLIQVDDQGRTSVTHIFAAGDVVGPPSLASASMEQGRRAACALLGLEPGRQGDYLPSGIYSVPELASVGLTEAQARQQFGEVVVGRAHYREIARGLIADSANGLLKLVATHDGRLRGVHIVGAQATDLIHIGQMALINDAQVSVFVENVFNFPTYAESYRVAALDLVAQLRAENSAPAGRTAA